MALERANKEEQHNIDVKNQVVSMYEKLKRLENLYQKDLDIMVIIDSAWNDYKTRWQIYSLKAILV